MKTKSEQEIFQDLYNLCTSKGYIHVLSFISFRDNIVFFGETPCVDDISHQFSRERLIRTEISTLIGLMIKENIDYSLPTPEIFQKYVNETDRLLEELHQSILKPAREIFKEIFSSTENKENPFIKGIILRESIFYASESAYDFQYLNLLYNKYYRDNEWFTSNLGFQIEQVQIVIQSIITILQKKSFDYKASIFEKPIEEWTQLEVFVFSTNEVLEITKLPKMVIKNILEKFSVNSNNESFKELGDFNVINSTPLIKANEDNYILFHHYSLLEAAYESPFFWFKEIDKKYAENIAPRNRGNFTEDFSYDILIKIFGENNVYKNIDIYNKKVRVGEIDVLVVFANRAIILQAKSKKLTLDARKGNDNLLERDFKQAIQDSYNQGYDCSTFIQSSSYTLKDSENNEIHIKRDFKEIYIFCVVSEHYPSLAFQTQQFLKYQETQVIKPPFVMDIFLLDIIAEFLTNPLYFLSYVNKRTSYFKEFSSQSELALLSYHLKRNLYLSKEFGMMLIDESISAELDFALLVRKKGIPGKDTPEGILTKFKGTLIGNFLENIQSNESDYTIEIGFLLLTLSEEAIQEINNGIQSILERFHKDGNNHDFSIGFKEFSGGITIHCNQFNEDVAVEKLKEHCEHRKYKEQSDNWFGLILDPITKSFKFGIMSDEKWCYSHQKAKKVIEIMKSNNIKIARNEKCPCGSGKKYKKCCLNSSN